jgi:hypothetical protein
MQILGWRNQYFCPLLHSKPETVYHLHLFMECSITHQVWLAIGCWAALPRFAADRWMPRRSVEEWFYALPGDVPLVKVRGSKTSLWCEQNAIIFSGKEKRVPRLITEIKDEAAF